MVRGFKCQAKKGNNRHTIEEKEEKNEYFEKKVRF
jgi:hypothetical protein